MYRIDYGPEWNYVGLDKYGMKSRRFKFYVVFDWAERATLSLNPLDPGIHLLQNFCGYSA